MAGAWDVVADALGFGGPSGDDHGSSNWAAWGHPEIRSMLDHSVDPGDIGEAASAWRALGRDAGDLVSGRTRDLNAMVAGGWRGAAADAAIAPLARIDQWSVTVAGTVERTTALMDAAGSSAAQAKAAVPPAKSHDWGESLRSFSVGGVPGAFVDAVAQQQEQSDAHAEAVRIMTNVYSAPINDHRAAVPTYPQLVDPTVQSADQPPASGGSAPVPLSSAAPNSASLYPTPLSSAAGAPGAGAGGSGVGHVAHQPPTAAALQGLTSAGAGAAVPADQATYRPQHLGGQSVAAAGVPITAPVAGGGAAGRPRAASSGARPGGVHAGGYLGGARSGGGHPADFGPRPSGGAAGVAEGRAGAGLGRGASGMGAGRGGAGEMMPPMGGGRGKGGEDSEHRRPSYLIEMDDIFTDGRKVAPAVIGQDPPE